MKKLFLLLGAMTLVSSLASATSIQSVFYTCPSFPGSITLGATTTGSATATCPSLGFILPGTDALTSVEVYYTSDYQFGETGANTVLTTFTPQPFSGVTWGAPDTGASFTCTSNGGFSSNTDACTYNFIVGPQQEYATETGAGPSTSGFTVNITATETGGEVGFQSYGVIVEYDYSTPAPEPASLLMVGGGAGLLGLARFFGKYLKKRS
jgi:hypothetical protein